VSAVRWHQRAKKDLAAMDTKQARHVIDAVVAYAAGQRGDTKALHGQFAGQYRLRVGDWRVIYVPDWAHGEVYVLRVILRRESYR
jgi:mRNA interferase RelE/StbE